jgi:hypothetical protein
MKIKQILATLILATLFVSCKDNININDVKYEKSLIYYDGGLLTGSATTLYENGKIHKIINSNKGKIRNQTHFNQQGDTIATMYYMQNGSFLKYVDKTIKNNIVEFEQCMESKNNLCVGSRNIPKFEYRLARLQDLWIKRNGLEEKLKNDASSTLLTFEGSTKMGSVLGNTKMYLKGGVSYPSYYDKQPEGPFNIENIAFTVEYGPYMRKSYNEQGRLSWDNTNAIDEYSNYGTVFKGTYSSIDESYSQGLDFTAEKTYNYTANKDDRSYSIILTISNKHATYQSKMIFYERDLPKTMVIDNEVNDIWDGKKIESQPGYSYNNFNLEWHHLHNEEIAQELLDEERKKATGEFINYMSKNDNKVYTDKLVIASKYAGDGNMIINGTEKRPETLRDGRTIEIAPTYYIRTFYMGVEDYAPVFKNYSPASLPFDWNDGHEGKVYEIEYIIRNWVENYETPDTPSEGKFLTKITLIE